MTNLPLLVMTLSQRLVKDSSSCLLIEDIDSDSIFRVQRADEIKLYFFIIILKINTYLNAIIDQCCMLSKIISFFSLF